MQHKDPIPQIKALDSIKNSRRSAVKLSAFVRDVEGNRARSCFKKRRCIRTEVGIFCTFERPYAPSHTVHTISKDTFRYHFESWIHLDTLLPLFLHIYFY